MTFKNGSEVIADWDKLWRVTFLSAAFFHTTAQNGVHQIVTKSIKKRMAVGSTSLTMGICGEWLAASFTLAQGSRSLEATNSVKNSGLVLELKTKIPTENRYLSYAYTQSEALALLIYIHEEPPPCRRRHIHLRVFGSNPILRRPTLAADTSGPGVALTRLTALL